MNKFTKNSVNLLIVLITVSAAIYYFNKHSSLLTNIRHIDWTTGLIVLALYLVMLLVLVLVFTATMAIANFKMGYGENILLNAYSIFINFFVPGQAGTAYRAYYLKKNHNLKVLDYTVATAIYYFMYALFSIVLISLGSQKWWITTILFILVSLTSFIAAKLYLAKFKETRLRISLGTLVWVAIATVVQAVVQVAIYWVELHSVNHHIRLDQAISYTGAADLALFVALTPAAIGIREAFLILSEKLHHVSTANIVLANVIDRSVFIVFLLFIGVVILIVKTNKHFKKLTYAFKKTPT